jgi:hypothetical protein
MTSDLQCFLADMLPASATPSAPRSHDVIAYLRVGGTEHAASVNRVLGPHFIVSHPAVPVQRGMHLVLSLVIREQGIRLDAPVEVVRTEGEMSTLRLRGRPLVMRRRVVTDLQLAEALGSKRPAPKSDVPMVA